MLMKSNVQIICKFFFYFSRKAVILQIWVFEFSPSLVLFFLEKILIREATILKHVFHYFLNFFWFFKLFIVILVIAWLHHLRDGTVEDPENFILHYCDQIVEKSPIMAGIVQSMEKPCVNHLIFPN